MFQVRKSEERGKANFGWLNSRHTFSFGHYYDPRHMGFGVLRVINDDRVKGGGGFDTHGHKDMEIISYVVEGALAHKDSMGNQSVIGANEVQRMSAGTGVLHSEFNHSKSSGVRFMQMWVTPKERGLKPSYEQKHFKPEKSKALRLLVSPNGDQGSISIHQDVRLYDAYVHPATKITHKLPKGRKTWVQVVNGELKLNGHALKEGDGVAITDMKELTFESSSQGQILMFDLPGDSR